MSSPKPGTRDHGQHATTSLGLPMPPSQRPDIAFPKLAVWSTQFSSPSVSSFSGAVAGIASGIVTCPLDVIKTKLQAQGSFSNPGLRHSGPSSSAIYHGLLGTARTIVRQDGLRGMYRGLGPMLLGYLPTWAVYMSVYDSSKDWFFTHGYGLREDDKFLPRVYASLTAGACSTVLTNPIWVIKTRLMSQVSRSAGDGARTPWHYNNTLDAARKMYHAEGMAAFYSGLGPALLGLTHVAIQFPLYEYFKHKITGLEMGEMPTSAHESWLNVAGILSATVLSKVCATSATYPHEVLRTRLQTQQRHLHPEQSGNGVAASHHSEAFNSNKRLGTSDGMHYRPRYHGIVRTAKIILQEEGWRAFYNGMGTNMIRAIPAAITTMLTFESVRTAVCRYQEEGHEILKDEAEAYARLNRKWT